MAVGHPRPIGHFEVSRVLVIWCWIGWNELFDVGSRCYRNRRGAGYF